MAQPEETGQAAAWLFRSWPVLVSIVLLILAWGAMQNTTVQNARTAEQNTKAIEYIMSVTATRGEQLATIHAKLLELDRADTKLITDLDYRTARRDKEYLELYKRLDELNKHLEISDAKADELSLIVARLSDRILRTETGPRNDTSNVRGR